MATNLNLYPSFLDNPPNLNNTAGSTGRLAPSAMASQNQQANGNGNGVNGMPMIAGQQMDVNMLYQKVMELSEVLKENREKTQGIVNGAEDLAVSATYYQLTILHRQLYICYVQEAAQCLPLDS